MSEGHEGTVPEPSDGSSPAGAVPSAAGGPTRWVKRIVSLALLAAVVVVIARTEGLATLAARLPSLSPGFFLVACAAQLTSVAVGVVRWRTLLALQGVTRPVGELARIYLVGRFVGVVTPGTTGLDVVRAIELGRRSGRPLESAAAIVVEKLFGVLGLALAVGIALSCGASALFGEGALPLAALAVFAALTLLPFAFAPARALPLIRKFPSRIANPVEAKLARLNGRSPTAAELLGLVALSTTAHLATAACYAASGAALGLPCSTGELLFVGMVIVAAMLVPISAGGAGVREGAAVVALRALDVPASDALLVALLGFLATQPPALLGGLVQLSERRPRA